MNSSAAALMALRAFRSTSVSNNNTWAISRSLATTKSGKPTGTSTGSTPTGGVNLAGKKLDPPTHVFKPVDQSDVGPGASKDSPNYKNPEYFAYHVMSFADMDLEMVKHRVPQPSNKKK